MADLLTEILEALIEPSARSAMRTAQSTQSEVHALEDEVAQLTSQVQSLQRTVATLTDLLIQSGALGESDKRAILKAARRPRFEVDPIDDADTDENPAMAVSPYRGASPIAASGCGVCGKPLAEDDPELTLASRGRVCTLCFTRGG